jgi:hypothetical protein
LFIHLLRAGRFLASLKDEERAMKALKRHIAATERNRHWLKESSHIGRRSEAPTYPQGVFVARGVAGRLGQGATERRRMWFMID